MRDRISVLYYPDFFVAKNTLKKAILLFDELHITDRPSFSFADIGGTIGAASPLRGWDAKFRNEGFPLYVHSAPMGQVTGELHGQVQADVNDPEFLRRFQLGLKNSEGFRSVQLPPGNYGEFGDQDGMIQKLTTVDLSTELKPYGSATALFEDQNVHLFRAADSLSCAKSLVFHAVMCSTKLNFALSEAAKRGFVPLADARPYGDLLGAKYTRAIRNLEPAKNNLQLTDFMFAIFDELVPTELLDKLDFPDVMRYRKASEKDREAFLEHVAVLHAKQDPFGTGNDYATEIHKLVMTEILPAAREFRNKLQTTRETLFGALVKGAIGAPVVPVLLGVLGYLSLGNLLSAAGLYIAKAAIDQILAERAIRRECSISYILSLDE